jgi:hypothetical protein
VATITWAVETVSIFWSFLVIPAPAPLVEHETLMMLEQGMNFVFLVVRGLKFLNNLHHQPIENCWKIKIWLRTPIEWLELGLGVNIMKSQHHNTNSNPA